MKSKQFCSVCKEWLEMEVVPTGDGEDDDGVVWYRCPQCQGFLPKLKSSDPAAQHVSEAADDPAPADTAVESEPAASEDPPVAADTDPEPADDAMPWDSPADMMASRQESTETGGGSVESVVDEVPVSTPKVDESDVDSASETEPIAEYAAMLAETDQGEPRPYRPWDTYDVGDCILHLAWEDCGIVVAKEDLPGGRQVIKCYFAEAGVVRLIEKAPR